MIYKSLITILTILFTGCATDKTESDTIMDTKAIAATDVITDADVPQEKPDEKINDDSESLSASPVQTPSFSNNAPAYIEMPAMKAPTKVSIGMKVADALCVPGATQSVSAIMTGGKITGTVVIQWEGKSYYTNVDFAQEGCYANGTRYSTPEDIEAFIELACSEQLHPSDFTDRAVVTELIK